MNPNCVLVVDDDSAMRSALETRFLRRGWRAETASSAGEALLRFRRGLHALVVTDIRMPGGDGLEVMRQARALAPHTAVILLTAFASVPEAVRDERWGLLIGVVAYWPQSFARRFADAVALGEHLLHLAR